MGKKDRTTQQILKVATDLFLSDGLLAVGMERIAELAEMTRRNLYRHFPTRESLAYAVTANLLDAWNQEQRGIYDGLVGTGRKRLEDFFDALIASLDRQRPMLRFFGEFDVVFQDSLIYKPSPEMEHEFSASLDVSEDLVRELIELGMKDGSLRPGLNLKVLVPTITMTLWTLAQRIALRDRMIKDEFSVDGLDIVHQHLELVLRALEPASARRK
jgi:AcrR family transcriptional regulator